MQCRLAVLTTVLLALAVRAGEAQFAQYGGPGSLAESPVPARELVQGQAREARWRLGKLRLSPRLSIGNLGYVSNVFDSSDEQGTVSDFKGSAGAGLNSYLYLSGKALLNGFAAASYSWWKEQEQLRDLNGSYGLRLFGFLNRLQLQVEAARLEQERNLSSELEVPTRIAEDRVSLGAEIEIRGPFAFFGSAAVRESRHSDEVEQNVPGLTVSTLDRQTDAVNLGLSYTLSNGLKLGLGVEHTETDFVDDTGQRSNSGTGPLLRIALPGNRVDLSVTMVYRILEVDSRAQGDDLEQLTGTARAIWSINERLGLTAYAGQQLAYSALEPDSVFDRTRYGLSTGLEVTRRGSLSALAEIGRDQHSRIATDEIGRVDDFESLGVSFSFDLSQRLKLRLGFIETERDSNLAEFDRSYTSVLSSIELGGGLLDW